MVQMPPLRSHREVEEASNENSGCCGDMFEVAGFWAPLALAQQKTVQACRAEWQANRPIYQPKGITEEEYIDECRGFRKAPATHFKSGCACAEAQAQAHHHHTHKSARRPAVWPSMWRVALVAGRADRGPRGPYIARISAQACCWVMRPHILDQVQRRLETRSVGRPSWCSERSVTLTNWHAELEMTKCAPCGCAPVSPDIRTRT
jgi:hypothetical protein